MKVRWTKVNQNKNDHNLLFKQEIVALATTASDPKGRIVNLIYGKFYEIWNKDYWCV